MWIGVVTLFPEMFSAVSDYGVSGRAIRQGRVALQCWNPRDFASDRHRTVDDRPYGGGPGMLMKTGPLAQAIEAARAAAGDARVISLSPQGRRLDQHGVRELSRAGRLILLCGRYEGIDERIVERYVDEEWSLGDFVLSGGELAAMTLIDAVTRLQPGVLGHEDSAVQDSFSRGLLDHPHYTRPEEFEGQRVPSVLLSGDHGAIEKWRLKQSLGRTWLRRPELLETASLTDEERSLLDEFIGEQARNSKHGSNAF